MKRQTYHRKQSVIQSDNNSLATLLEKKAHARLCEVVNTCPEKRTEKCIQRKT